MRLKLALSLSACRQARSPNEIDNASRVKREEANTDWPRRFIRGSAEDAKFEENREVIINPAVDAGFGATRRRRDGKAGGCGNRGNSGNHQPVPRERGFGETRELKPEAKPEGVGVRGDSQPYREAQLEARSRGATRSTSTRCAEGRETRGNSRVRRR